METGSQFKASSDRLDKPGSEPATIVSQSPPNGVGHAIMRKSHIIQEAHSLIHLCFYTVK